VTPIQSRGNRSKLRKVVTADGASYWLRPSFVAGYMTGTVEELAFPLLLAAHGVPAWLLTIGFGRGEMYWYRAVERLGRSSLVGATVRDPARLPGHLAADEHHADWPVARATSRPPSAAAASWAWP
jgi:hypothetical protein